MKPWEERGLTPDVEEEYGNIILVLYYDYPDEPAMVYHIESGEGAPYDHVIQWQSINGYDLTSAEWSFLKESEPEVETARLISSLEDISTSDVYEIAEMNGLYIDDSAGQYGEPGYSLEKGQEAILFADWNPWYKNLGDAFMEKLEEKFAIEWSDEWIVNYDTDKAYRTSPTSYGWQPYYYMIPDMGEIIGVDDMEDDPSIFIESVLPDFINEPNKAINFDTNIDTLMKEAGYELASEDTYESGWHPHQTDDPKKILEEALEEEPEGEFVFTVPYVGQFDINFNLWRKAKPKPMSPKLAALPEVARILVQRDDMTPDEAMELLEEARERVRDGENPEEILYEDFGLEPDYIWDLID